ncbi:MAG: carbohydrate ABC transporter permease [bacterium]|nr:carbohydrate ABC transporter permease [Candidatus Sumerlaeota bacterium]
MNRSSRGARLLGHLVLCLGGLFFLVPFAWMIRVSLTPEWQLASGLKLLYEWKDLAFANYPKALTLQPFWLYFLNTYLVTILALAGEVFVSALVAYGFARFAFRGREALFLLVLSTMMIPPQVTMVPTFILFRWLGWIDTFLPLIVPSWAGSAFGIFLARQFVRGLPRDLDSAALIDGCGPFEVFRHVILPLLKPALMVIAVFGFIGRWNDLLTPLIYLNTQAKFTISLGLLAFQGQYSTQLGYLMAVSVTAMIPCIVLFLVAQDYFIKGLTLGAVKG